MSAGAHTFVGFGFGPIQAGLFLLEAHCSGQFRRLVVAEVVPEVVAALRAAGGAYRVNVATAGGIETRTIDGVEAYNPNAPEDRARLVEAVAEAQELATALPSVNLFASGGAAGVAGLLADGLARKAATGGPRAVLYAGENHNHAAELLAEALRARGAPLDRLACLNTVIGKMSGTVTEAAAIREQGLAPMTPGGARAFLVEAFNRILIARVPWAGFARGLAVFDEKADLLPFEEAKLYGHNAVHAWLAYHLWARGARELSDAATDAALMARARAAFLLESGAALCRKHAGVDALFTPAGFAAYADDLLARMINPYLRDAVARVARDPARKLGWNDRLVGTMRLALGQGIRPVRFAQAARLAWRMHAGGNGAPDPAALRDLWAADRPAADEVRAVLAVLEETDHEH